jgi:hypothetical protein
MPAASKTNVNNRCHVEATLRVHAIGQRIKV